MCGIAGVVAAHSIDADRETEKVARMVRALKHRGPDDDGLSAHGRAVLGHTRLSIIDLSDAGHQPLANEDGTVHVVYNGEIYNFPTLRRALIEAGHHFSSNTDTEVLVHGYEQWGLDGLLERIDGMFAFALWDERQETLHLVRDRLGIKPLFFASRCGRLVFASEPKALIAYDEKAPPMRPEALLASLHHVAVPAPATMYEQYEALEPGTVLTWSAGDGAARVRRYWTWRRDPVIDDPAVAETKLWETLCASVERHLIADVPIGIFLSGGLDSSLVAAACAEIGRRVTCITIAIDDEQHDESGFARMVCERFGLEHRVLPMAADAGRAFEDGLADMFDEPFASSAALSAACIAQSAAQEFIVMLAGDGGDELFGGYKWYRQWIERYGRDGQRRPVAGAARAWARRLTGRRDDPADPLAGYARLLGALEPRLVARLFDPAWIDRCGTAIDPAAIYRDRDDLGATGFDRLQALDLQQFLPNVCLRKVDRTSMHFGLEVRVPWLDRSVVDVAASTSEQVRNPDGRLKGLVKRVARTRLPAPLLEKRKQGFSTPIRRWFPKERMLDEMRRTRDAGDWWRGVFANDAVSAAGALKGRPLWRIYMTWQWVRRHRGLTNTE